MIVPYRSACVCMECSLSAGLRVSPNGAIAKFGVPHKEESVAQRRGYAYRSGLLRSAASPCRRGFRQGANANVGALFVEDPHPVASGGGGMVHGQVTSFGTWLRTAEGQCDWPGPLWGYLRCYLKLSDTDHAPAGRYDVGRAKSERRWHTPHPTARGGEVVGKVVTS
jgi:hypothetical protein